MVRIQVHVISNQRQRRVLALLRDSSAIMELTPRVLRRAGHLEKLGFKAADAVHVAAAEDIQADVLLTCDDRFCRLGQRRGSELRVMIANPAQWILEEI